MRWLGAGLAVAAGFVYAACNGLSGVGDLTVCGDDCAADGDGGPVPRGGSDAGTDGSTGLPPTCTGTEAACASNVAAQCVGGAWQMTTCPETCLNGQCAPLPSCRSASGTGCGGTASTSCCTSAAVPGGTFNRRNSSSYPATVSPFMLDVFEVTVGRFRAFLDAGGATTTQPPAAGAGAHPKIPGSGWLSDWNPFLPASVTALRTELAQVAPPTWTDDAGANEHLPITNVSWFEAFAFCAWDGGRLPTYAEWNFAAAGGAEQRVYPWSSPSTDTTLDTSHAAYDCARVPPAYACPPCHCSSGASAPCDVTCIAPNTYVYPACTGCDVTDIAPVGSYPRGAGKWGHLDLTGNVYELVLDYDPSDLKGPGGGAGMPVPVPCTDCAALVGSSPQNVPTGKGGNNPASFISAGGAWSSPTGGFTSTVLMTSAFQDGRYDGRSASVGIRCARD